MEIRGYQIRKGGVLSWLIKILPSLTPRQGLLLVLG